MRPEGCRRSFAPVVQKVPSGIIAAAAADRLPVSRGAQRQGMDLLTRGAFFVKHGRSGRPKQKFVCCTQLVSDPARFLSLAFAHATPARAAPSLVRHSLRLRQRAGMRLDDERLFVLFGGRRTIDRRAFKTRLTDSVSCAIARGTGYVACVAAERLIYAIATMGHHSQVMPDVQQLN